MKPKLSFRRNGLWKACFISFLACAIFFSCKNNDSNPNQLNGISQINCMLMHPSDVEKLAVPGTGEETYMFSKLIIRIASTNLPAANPVFTLLGYRARHHEEFGRDLAASPIAIPASPNCENPLRLANGTLYVLGNNDLSSSDIIRVAKDGTRYHYLLFTPKVAPNGQIFFRIDAADATGVKIPRAVEVFAESKPSPPARPEP